MGEWSKSVGETGEKIIKFLFEEILGFNSLIENESIYCINSKTHQISNSPRSTHGIDGLIYYSSPTEDKLLDCVVISSKYTSKTYPKNPKSDSRKFLNDLAHTIECFNRSELFSKINQTISNVEKTEITGVLVWLSNESPVTDSILPEISNINIDTTANFDKLVVVDNSRINFLFNSVYLTKNKFGSNNVDFIYHNTSLNQIFINNKTFGKLFPINYLYSDLILLRVQNNFKIEFHIFVNDDFSIELLGQILSLAKAFNHLDALEKTVIHFITFDILSERRNIQSTLQEFSDYRLDQNLFIQIFPDNFRNN